MNMANEVYQYLSLLRQEDLVPPLVFQVNLNDGREFFIYNVHEISKENDIAKFRIWDFRGIDKNKHKEILRKLDSLSHSERLNPENIHSDLDWGWLFVKPSNITSCILWHDRLWPENMKNKIGF